MLKSIRNEDSHFKFSNWSQWHRKKGDSLCTQSNSKSEKRKMVEISLWFVIWNGKINMNYVSICFSPKKQKNQMQRDEGGELHRNYIHDIENLGSFFCTNYSFFGEFSFFHSMFFHIFSFSAGSLQVFFFFNSPLSLLSQWLFDLYVWQYFSFFFLLFFCLWS